MPNARVISQYAGEDSHAERIAELLTKHNEGDQLRVLCAFVTMGGLQSIATPLREFLERGGTLDWIVGIDDVTDRQALQYLYDLETKYPTQIDIRIFSSGTQQYLFHPKVYWLISDEKYTAIVGSANLTVGGLLANFETSIEVEVSLDESSELVKQLEQLWIQYSTPLTPMGPENLVDLTSEAGLKLLKAMEQAESEGDKKRSEAPKSHPLGEFSKGNKIHEKLREKFVRAPKTKGTRKKTRAKRHGGAEGKVLELPKTLIMDIQTETRETQVQIPVKVMKGYFNTDPTEEKSINLSYASDGEILSNHDRPFVHLPHNNTHRLEIETIRGVRRPLIIRFDRDEEDPDRYTYQLILRGTPEYSLWNHELDLHGSRTRPDSKRWVVLS